MFERFTEKAIKAIMLAQEEARRLEHNFVGTEQILLGLIREGKGVAAKVLKSMGVNLKDSRVEVEKIIGRGSGFVDVEIPFTPRAQRVLELSLEEARQLGHNYIGTEHLLLALIREGEGVAAGVLKNLGVILSDLQSLILSRIDINKKTIETNKDDFSEDLFDKNLSIKEYLAILGIYDKNQLEENDIYFWWTKKFKEIEGESILNDVKSNLLIKINNAKDQLEKISEEIIINSLLSNRSNQRNQSNYSYSNEDSVDYEYSTNHSKPDEKAQESSPGSSKSKVTYDIGIYDLTPEVIRAIELGKNELIIDGYNCFGTEQMLTGLLLVDSISSEILYSLGVNLSKLKKEIINFLGKGEGFIVENIPFTPNAKYVFESAQKEAFRLKIEKVEPLIILLCLVKSEKFLSYKILNNLNIDIYDLQEKIYKNLGKEEYFINSILTFKLKIKDQISKCEGYISNQQYAKAIIDIGKFKKLIVEYKNSHKNSTKTSNKFLDRKILFLTEKSAIAKSMSNDFLGAVGDYDLLIEQNYSLVNCLSSRAKIFLKLKSYSRALNDLDRLLKTNPSMLSILLLRAEIFETIKEYNSALNDYKKIRSINSNYRSSYVFSKIKKLSYTEETGNKRNIKHQQYIIPNNILYYYITIITCVYLIALIYALLD